MKCRRCAGPMFPDEEGERFCLMCGERTYDSMDGFLDRLLDAMERQALKELRAGRELRVSSPESRGRDFRLGTRDSGLGTKR